MPKRIAVIATKAKFKEIRRFFRKSLPFPVDKSMDDYLAVMDLYLYRIDNPKSNFIDAYQWSGYVDSIDWEVDSGRDWEDTQNLLRCMQLMEVKEVPIWNAVKIVKEIEEMALPF